jgi:hypothetical protein
MRSSKRGRRAFSILIFFSRVRRRFGSSDPKAFSIEVSQNAIVKHAGHYRIKCASSVPCPAAPGRTSYPVTAASNDETAGSATKIAMFGYPEPMKWKFDSATGLKIDIPESLQQEDRRPNQYAWAWTIRTA